MKGKRRSADAAAGEPGRKRYIPLNKKGATMVEAALIFPLVIAGVMAVLYIVIGLYSSLSLQTSLHMALRKECGELSKTVYRLEAAEEAESAGAAKAFQGEKGLAGIRPVVRMEKEREYKINTLFRERVIRKEAGRSYIINEAELARILSFDEGES